MRRPLICANWKMHTPPDGWDATDSPYRTEAGTDIVVFPSYPHIAECVHAKMIVGGQSGRPEPEGAFTGDVSIQMLKDTGCHYVLCGHSERRQHHGETDEFIAEQVIAALEVGLHPVLCIGETKEQRDAGKTQDVVRKQLCQLSAVSYQLSVAYEPVWAIGTGIHALPDDVQEIHKYIRSLLTEKNRESVRILYGGSVNDLNAADLLAHEDIDGFLVGTCSLEPERFHGIVEAAMTDS